MLNTISTALVAAFFLVVFLAVGAAVYVVAGMPGMAAMHNTEYRSDRVGSLVNEPSWNMHRTNKIESEAATPAR